MKLYYYLFSALIIFTFTNCKQTVIKQTVKNDFYVISKKDSINRIYNDTNKIPPPIIPQEHKWYTDLVFIMDSSEKVYVYQTETKFANKDAHFDYPNYIGLKPEYLVTLNSKDFVNFLKNNNDIFGVFPNAKNFGNAFYIASESDTIKNQALSNLWKALDSTKSRSISLVRKTTEEENVVLQYKRNNKEYEPKAINWSTKFYNGEVKPFTKEYDALEKKIHSLVIAKQTFKKKIEIINM